MNERIEYLEKLLPLKEKTLEKKYYDKFSKQSMYKGNGVYQVANMFSVDTRELLLMFYLMMENINFKKI